MGDNFEILSLDHIKKVCCQESICIIEGIMPNNGETLLNESKCDVLVGLNINKSNSKFITYKNFINVLACPDNRSLIYENLDNSPLVPPLSDRDPIPLSSIHDHSKKV